MLERRARLSTGLILAAYVISHLINHALGIVSVDAMEAYRRVNSFVWQSYPGTVALYGSFVVHALLALHSLFRRTTLRMPWWEALQLTLGLMIPPLIAVHVIGTRLSQSMLGFDADYPYVLLAQWSNLRYVIQQPLLILVVWSHLVIGLHFWLRLKRGYAPLVPVLYGLAVLLPTLALLGWVRGGIEVQALASDPDNARLIMSGWRDAPAADRRFIQSLEPATYWTMGALLALALMARVLRRWLRRRRGQFYSLAHPRAGAITGRTGQSVLEALRDAGIAHASVCGGRARCTTCRVRVGAGREQLAAPSALEATALDRIRAPENVRLACQTRPSSDLSITPLLPANAGAADAHRPGGVGGHEQQVAAMFIDLRDSTRLGEERLPYDVVFILNQFFAEMSQALEDTRGHYAQFSGDGLMALYGLESDIVAGCRDALYGAVAMSKRLAALNESLAGEIETPLRIGIGIHCGEAIVGTMGPPSSPNLSAIGDNINIAARLEAMCKTHSVSLVVSAQVARHAGVNLSDFDLRAASVRGRAEPVAAYTISDAALIGELLSDSAQRNVNSGEPGV